MISRMVGMVVGNPMLLVWLILGAFGFGLASGGGAAWTVQGWKLDAVQSKFDGFVATTKAFGEAAQVAADKTKAEDKRRQEKANHEKDTTIANLLADNKRMRVARSSSSFLPPASAITLRPDRACFDRAKLDQSIRELDSGLQGILEACDVARLNLDNAKRWAAD